MITSSDPHWEWTGKHSVGAAALTLLGAGSLVVMVIGAARGFGWVGAVGLTIAAMTFAQLMGHARGWAGYRPAIRHHNRRIYVATIAYGATFFGALKAHDAGLTAGPLGYVIAVAPALPALVLVGSIFLILRQETDEFLRARLIEASMWAAGLTIAEAMIWGFLEMFGKVPHVWMWVVPMFFIVQFGIAGAILGRRYR